MGDDRFDVQSALEHHGHFVPGLVHLPPVNAFDRQHIEDDFVPVDGHFCRRNAQHGDLAAVAQVVDHVAEGRGVAGHFQTDVEALFHAELPLHLAELAGAHIQGHRGPQLPGQAQPIIVQIGNHDKASAGVSGDGRGHDADGAGAGDQHVLPQHGEGQRRVHRVAERVEDRLHVARNVRIVYPHVGHRQGEVFRESAGPVDADPLRVLAEMPPARQAVAAAAAHHVPFAADDVADVEVLDVRAGLGNRTDEFMADDHRHGDGLLRPGIPLVNVHVGAADSGPVHADENVVDPDRRPGGFLQPQTGFGFAFDQRLHGWSWPCANRKSQIAPRAQLSRPCRTASASLVSSNGFCRKFNPSSTEKPLPATWRL